MFTTREKYVYIPIEIKLREFVSQIYLASELVSRGFSVFLGSHAAIFSLLKSSSSCGGIYLDKGTQILSRSAFIKTRVDKMFILDQELSPNISVLDYRGFENIVSTRFYPGTEDFVDAFFTISEPYTSQAKAFLHRGEIIESGWPRFQFLHDKSREYYKTHISRIQREHKRFTFFPSNLSIVNDIEATIKSTSDSFVGPLGLSPQRLELEELKAVELAKLFVEWRRCGFLDPIVVRPHLMESMKKWKQIMSNVPDLHVIRRYEIFPWLHSASQVIHFGSTSAIQAAVIGKRTYWIESLAGKSPSGLSVTLSDGMVNSENDPNYPHLTGIPYENESLKIRIASNNSREIIAEYVSSLIDEISTVSYGQFGLLTGMISTSKLRRGAGLLRDEIQAFLGYLPVNSQMQNIPWGITKFEVKRVIKRLNEHVDNLRVTQHGLNLVKISPKFNS